jgi:hypothetical protein
MTTLKEEYGTALELVEVVDAELVDADAPGAGEVAVHDPLAAVLAALDTKAAEDLHESRPDKTKSGYARDWELWGEFHDWLAEQTGVLLPLSTITVGTYVALWQHEVGPRQFRTRVQPEMDACGGPTRRSRTSIQIHPATSQTSRRQMGSRASPRAGCSSGGWSRTAG